MPDVQPKLTDPRSGPGRLQSLLAEDELPRHLVERAIARLRFLAATTAVLFTLVQSIKVIALGPPALGTGSTAFAAVGVLASLVMFAIAGADRLSSRLRTRSGAVYAIAIACVLSLGLSHRGGWWADGDLLEGAIPWTALWIAVVPAYLPTPMRHTIPLVLAMAASAPLAVALAGASGVTAAPALGYVEVSIAPLVAAFAALVPSAVLQRMGRDVDRARRLGSYQLEERIGRGGMGEVWRARHRMLIRPAAVKLIRPEKLQGAGTLDAAMVRFHREAQATAALRSPHTIQLHDFGISDDGTLYYAMELLDGISLGQLVVRFGAVPPARAIHLLRQIASSLAEAHRVGLVHRDVKPDNVLACRMGEHHDFVKVLDFGLARPIAPGGADALEGDAGAAGTPAHMAPEVLAEGAADERVDLYGLGCVGYWLVTGELVFSRTSPAELARAHASEPPVPPSERSGRAVPPELEALILDCLAKRPADRPATARDIIGRLEACADTAPWTPEAARSWWSDHVPEMPSPTLGSGTRARPVDVLAETQVDGSAER